MYIKLDKVRIKRIVLDLHDVIADSKKVAVFELEIRSGVIYVTRRGVIQRQQPSLNQQLHHVNLKLSF